MAKKIRLCVVSPTRQIYDKDVDMAVLRTVNGDIGVMSGHEALTAALGYGILVIINDDVREILSVLGGFAEILPDRITVLSELVEWPGEIDLSRAEEAKERAEHRLKHTNDSVNVHRAELALRRALVRIEVSSYPLLKERK